MSEIDPIKDWKEIEERVKLWQDSMEASRHKELVKDGTGTNSPSVACTCSCHRNAPAPNT